MKMRLATIIIMIILLLFVTNCGRINTIDGVTYNTYGVFNESNEKDPKIRYEVIWPNVFFGVLFIQTIIVPIYFFGFSMFEPIRNNNDVKGTLYKSDWKINHITD